MESSIPTTAPADPRLGWELPDFGELPPVATLDELATRVLAPNPSPMTLDGTNTYVLGAPGQGEAVVVDPGPEDRDHFAAVEAALRDRDARAALVLVTHHHIDHAEAAASWASRWDCPVAARARSVAGRDGILLEDGQRLSRAGIDLEVVATPGHTADHLAVRLPTGALLTGDHVLGRGTSVVAHPDGDLEAYLDSLRTVLGLGPDALYPGHGPELTEDPSAVLEYYLDHRAFRRRQILAALTDGPATPRQLVEVIYADVDRRLWGAAEASTRAALGALTAAGHVREDGTGRYALTASR